MAFDFTATQRNEIERLCKVFDVKKLFIFGSALTERFDSANSDLDFVAEFGHSENLSPSRQFFGFLGALEDLFNIPVDLLELSAIDNPYLRREVDGLAVALYAA
jgi:predicted nucleotidyltransferase